MDPLTTPAHDEPLLLDDEAAPLPRLAIRNGVDVQAMVEKYIDRRPGATADEIVAEFARGEVKLNATLVSQQLLQRARRVIEQRNSE